MSTIGAELFCCLKKSFPPIFGITLQIFTEVLLTLLCLWLKKSFNLFSSWYHLMAPNRSVLSMAFQWLCMTIICFWNGACKKNVQWSYDLQNSIFFALCIIWENKTKGFIFLDKAKLSQCHRGNFCIGCLYAYVFFLWMNSWIHIKSMLVEIVCLTI